MHVNSREKERDTEPVNLGILNSNYLFFFLNYENFLIIFKLKLDLFFF